ADGREHRAERRGHRRGDAGGARGADLQRPRADREDAAEPQAHGRRRQRDGGEAGARRRGLLLLPAEDPRHLHLARHPHPRRRPRPLRPQPLAALPHRRVGPQARRAGALTAGGGLVADAYGRRISLTGIAHSSRPCSPSSAPKRTFPPTRENGPGAEASRPGRMSPSGRVPAAVPSLRQGSRPWTPSVAAKTRTLPIAVSCCGYEPARPGRRSATRPVEAAVPWLAHSSAPVASL